MPEAELQTDLVEFPSRRKRTEYLVERFGEYIRSPVLDVGCCDPVIPELLPEVEYTGVDVIDDADIQLDLETIDKLPFEENEFQCVICADTLEHLDNLHEIFDELVRVAAKTLIISLPNNWNNARVPIERGRGDIGHYGLPAEEPDDRHKWFFAMSEAVGFLQDQAEERQLRLVDLVANEETRVWITRFLRKLRYWKKMQYLDRYAHTIWVVYAVES